MKNKKVYSTPEGLKYSASCSFSNASLAWIANLIWQYLIQMIRVQGTTALILAIVGFLLLLYGAISAYQGFETEIQADSISNEIPNKTLPKLRKLTMACIIVRFVLILLSVFASLVFSSIKGTPQYVRIDSFINIIGTVFTAINILVIFAYKIFVDEGYEKKIKIYSLVTLISGIARFLFCELNYLVKFSSGSGSKFFSVMSIAMIVSYFSMFLMFEARKAIYKPSSEK